METSRERVPCYRLTSPRSSLAIHRSCMRACLGRCVLCTLCNDQVELNQGQPVKPASKGAESGGIIVSSYRPNSN